MMSAQVKCILCGAVFDASLSVCPVCGAGREHFMPVPSEPAAHRRDTEEMFLILGGGVAAMRAAEAIRARNAACAITLVTEESVPPYNRPMLTKSPGAAHADIAMHDETWYAANNILVLTERRCVSLDAAAHEATLADGIRLRYDKCVYALGARCFVPPIPGTELPEVLTLRNVDDAGRLWSLLSRGARKAVVIGGGVLGLEAAWALRQRGCAVTVLERSDRAMSRQLDAEASAMLAEAAARADIAIRCGADTESILGDGHVTGVRLKDGTRFPADLVVVSSGVRPNTDIAKAAGANVGRAVQVNDAMETSLPDVYACGDCAELGSANIAIWPVAAEMGRVAGANAAGDALSFRPVSAAITFQGMRTALYADGRVDVQTSETTRDDSAMTLEKRFFDGNRLCGVILLGDISKAAEYADALGIR